MKDKIIEEIRAVRRKADHLIEKDPKQFQAEIAEIRKKYQSRLINIGPRQEKKKKAA
jgi:ElaB/YqjD/DUF883 family membrane-anchored ribosome-binding protein